MTRSFRTVLIIIALVSVSLIAGPKIQITPKIFDCGTILEGKTDKLLANFSVANSGDSVLKLTNVRPGCGCTVVKYDTLVLPGKSATINAQVNIAGYHTGAILKSITVSSNAANDPTIKLEISATIQSVVDASVSYVGLNCGKTGAPFSLYLFTQKKDLKVTNVSAQTTFKPDSTGKKGNVVLSIKYAWAPTDSVRKDGYHGYKLTLFPPQISATTAAVFTIALNHPDKKETVISGELTK